MIKRGSITITSVEFHPHGDVVIPCCGYQSDISRFDWRNQSMFYHAVLITVSNKHLVIVKISVHIDTRSDCFKGSQLILFPSEIPRTDKRRANKNGIRWCILIFASRRESVEKIIHQNKNWGHPTCKIFKSRQCYSNGHLPYHCLFYYLAHALMHDVACE